MRALLVFFDPDETPFDWLLRPGFRHVFAAVDDGNYWLLIDGRDQRPVFEVIQRSDYDLAGFYREQGYRVVEVEQGPAHRWPFAIVTCVGLVKAALCIHAPLALTPYGLFKHLTRRGT